MFYIFHNAIIFSIRLHELKQLNYSLDVQLKREQEERQKIEQQLMALYGTRSFSSPSGRIAKGSSSYRSSAIDNADEFYNDHGDLNTCELLY